MRNKVSPLLRMTLGQRGAFPKDAFNFNGVSETALPPAWPGVPTQGREALGEPQLSKERGKIDLYRLFAPEAMRYTGQAELKK